MAITTKEIEIDNFVTDDHEFLILPANYTDKENYKYYESSLSFYKFANDKVDIGYLDEPEVLLAQRSGEWFGPVIFVSSLALTNNPELIAIMCGVIANYITDIFKGKKEPEIELKVIYKQTKTTKYSEIKYKGNVSGLSEINDAIQEIAKNSKND